MATTLIDINFASKVMQRIITTAGSMSHRKELVITWVQHTNLLIPACGGDETAIVVPGHGVDDVRVVAL